VRACDSKRLFFSKGLCIMLTEAITCSYVCGWYIEHTYRCMSVEMRLCIALEMLDVEQQQQQQQQ